MKIINKNRQEKGITLIALVITIIVLLILAVVSIRLVMNNGILGKAEKGVSKYQEAETDEQEQLLKAEYEMAKYEGKFSGSYTEYVVDKKYPGLKVGDYVKYDATTDAKGKAITGDKAIYTSYSEEEAKEHPERNEGRTSGYTSNQVFNLSSYKGGWRVLGVKNGQLELISADIILTSSGSKYYLQGKKGYTDGPAELNAIAGLYGQGKGATGARSIDVKDINDITGYKPEKTGDGKPYGSGTVEEYNNKVTYYWDGTEYPYYEYGEGKTGKLRNKHSTSFNWYDGKNWQSSAKSTTSNRVKITDLTKNYYWYYPRTLTTSSSGDTKGIKKTSKEWEVLFAMTCYPIEKYYWLASPYVNCGTYYAAFGLRFVHEGSVFSSGPLVYSSSVSDMRCGGVRSIVTLKSDVQVNVNAGDGKAPSTAYEIK